MTSTTDTSTTETSPPPPPPPLSPTTTTMTTTPTPPPPPTAIAATPEPLTAAASPSECDERERALGGPQPFAGLIGSSAESLWGGMMTLRSRVPLGLKDMQAIAWKGSHPHSLKGGSTVAPPIKSPVEGLASQDAEAAQKASLGSGQSLERYRSHIYEMSVFRGVYVKPRSKSDAGSHRKVDYSEIEEPLNRLTEEYRAVESVEIDERVPPPLCRSEVDDRLKKKRAIRLERFRHKIFTEFNEKKPDDTFYPSDNAKGSLNDILFAELNKGAACSVSVLREIVWENGCSVNARHIVWPILLGCVPPEAAARERVLCQKRKEYAKLVEKWYVPIMESERAANDEKQRTGSRGKNEENTALVKQIYVDVLRTHPEGFNNTFNYQPVCEMLNRILIVWSKIHANVGYFQGLNELPTTFIMVFIREKLKGAPFSKENLDKLTTQDFFEVEADSYWCLCSVMKQILVNNAYVPLLSRFVHLYFLKSFPPNY